MGGFTGSDPAPTLAEFEQWVKAGDITYYIAGGGMGGGPGRRPGLIEPDHRVGGGALQVGHDRRRDRVPAPAAQVVTPTGSPGCGPFEIQIIYLERTGATAAATRLLVRR